tara:strand:+ start:147 stop:461 length:315 start_codon:yes stop_codon:yes gene_type:complete
VEAHSIKGKIPVVDTDRFEAYIEWYDGKVFGHVDVLKWDKTTKKEIHTALNILVNTYKAIYALHDIDDNKHRKFLEMYKFKYFSTEHCLDGLYRQVWIKESTNG